MAIRSDSVRDLLDSLSASASARRRRRRKKVSSAWDQLLSWPFANLAVYMTVSVFWANNYLGTLNEQLEDISGVSKEQASHYADYFNLVMVVGVPLLPFFGKLIDRFGHPVAMLLTSLLGIVFAICAVVNSLPVQWVTFIAYGLFRTFLFAVYFSYAAYEFGFRYFGLVTALPLMIAGGLCTMQSPMVDWFHHTYHTMNVIQLVTLAPMVVCAVYVGHRRRNGLTLCHPHLADI